MYANNVELLFWPDSHHLAQWMQAEKKRKESEQDQPQDPTSHRLVTGGATYKSALESIVGQFKVIDIQLDATLIEDMIEAAASKDEEEQEQAMEDSQVFIGVLINTLH